MKVNVLKLTHSSHAEYKEYEALEIWAWCNLLAWFFFFFFFPLCLAIIFIKKDENKKSMLRSNSCLAPVGGAVVYLLLSVSW